MLLKLLCFLVASACAIASQSPAVIEATALGAMLIGLAGYAVQVVAPTPTSISLPDGWAPRLTALGLMLGLAGQSIVQLTERTTMHVVVAALLQGLAQVIALLVRPQAVTGGGPGGNASGPRPPSFATLLVLAAGLGLLLPACPAGCPGGPKRLIECSGEAIATNAAKVQSAVVACLSGGGTTACLLGLINPAAGITEDVIACLVRAEASKLAVEPEDVGRSERARSFLRERGYRFSEE